MSAHNYGASVYAPEKAPKLWRAALYIRLSKEDELAGESNSISSQREILREHLKQHPDIVEYDCYIDDGWTGTNFDRPGFNRMMQDIYDGNVNCVIVKDLSRFGRNYSKGGELLTSEFVKLGVRFISTNNYYDSLSSIASTATGCITLGITNVINESVSATTSANVRATLNINRQQGKFIGSFACYGYQKDPEDHHHLIIDSEAAQVVRMIYQKFIEGRSIIGIAKDLNELGIPNPTAYKALKSANYRHPSGKRNDGLWLDSSIRRILTNEMYIGNMVQGKNKIISYKDQVARACPKEDWYIVPNTHEAIIDPSVFQKAQSLFCRQIRHSPATNETYLLSGLVRCGDCQRIMNMKTNIHPYGTFRYYRCATRRKMKVSGCSNHTIRMDKLEQAVFVYIQSIVALAVETDELIQKIKSSNHSKNEITYLEKTLSSQQSERDKCLAMMLDLYPDWKSGILTKEEYLALKTSMQEKIDSLNQGIEKLEASVADLRNNHQADNEFISHFKQYKNFQCLTRPMVTSLIDSIDVYEGNRIQINLKFQDAYEQLLNYLAANADTA